MPRTPLMLLAATRSASRFSGGSLSEIQKCTIPSRTITSSGHNIFAHSSPIPNPPAPAYVVDSEPNEVTAPELAVNG
jgi:hypothetical protein